MHIQEAVLTQSALGIGVLGAGAALAAAGTALGLRRMDYERMPRVAMLSSAFFVASLIHVPMVVGWTHLALNGLIGLVLGWAAFPAILIALVLQSVFFGECGLTTIGVNTVTMALPAVASHYLFRGPARGPADGAAFTAGFAAGASATLLGAVLASAAIATAGESFRGFAQAFFVVHLPLAAAEGMVTASAVVFLRKVRPELLDAPVWMPARLEISDV